MIFKIVAKYDEESNLDKTDETNYDGIKMQTDFDESIGLKR